MILTIVPLVILIIISTIALGYIIVHRKLFYNSITIILISFSYIVFGILYPTFHFISLNSIGDLEIAIQFWRSSIFSFMLAAGLNLATFSITIDSEKYQMVSNLSICFITGTIISLFYSPNSVLVVQAGEINSFIITNSYLLTAILLFNFLIIILTFFVYIKSQFDMEQESGYKHQQFLFTLFISSIIILFSLYLIFQNILFIDLILILNFFGSTLRLYYIKNDPNSFVGRPNKIYEFILFQKSGILLYSFNFETDEETDDTLLKGSILIGINHIISNLIDRKNQLNLIKLQKHDMVFEYDINYGYALLLLTKKKNRILEKSVKSFMANFNDLNKESLKKIENTSLLVDISVFKNAKDLINNNFKLFIKKK